MAPFVLYNFIYMNVYYFALFSLRSPTLLEIPGTDTRHCLCKVVNHTQITILFTQEYYFSQNRQKLLLTSWLKTKLAAGRWWRAGFQVEAEKLLLSLFYT